MAAFYQDSRPRTDFDQGTNRFGQCGDPATCVVGLLEWSPGDPPRTAEIIKSNAEALRSRAQPRVQIVGDGRSPGIADPRGAVLSQGDWTWIRTSVFMRWDNCDDRDKATVALVIFSASAEMRDRFQRLWGTDLSTILVDPFSLFVICLDELWLQAQSIVRAVGVVFNQMERTALDVAASLTSSGGDGRHDFVGLHNVAKHIIFLKESSEAASMTISHLQDFHLGLLKNPPQGQDATSTMHMTRQMLGQKAVQFEVWTLRMTSLQQRMQNIINLSFNVVTQHDSHILKNDSKSMKAIAMVTMLFLPLATIAVRAYLALLQQ
ncbi:MAG: hypothetical protein Q9208_006789 [Pyrenodesmia sp. 3 TL-2023]